MHKRFALFAVALVCAAALLAAFSFISGSKSVRASATGLTSPLIVVQVSLTGQTEPIPVTTLFTPSTTGLYRVSSYMVMTEPAHSTQEQYWAMNIKYTDGVGGEKAGLLVVGDQQVPPYAYGYDPGLNSNAGAFTFHAVAGSPVSYSVGYDQSDIAAGTYDLYIVVEELT